MWMENMGNCVHDSNERQRRQLIPVLLQFGS